MYSIIMLYKRIKVVLKMSQIKVGISNMDDSFLGLVVYLIFVR